MNKLSIATGIIKIEGKYLIARRLEPEWLKGFWEFPGGTVEPHETIEETLVREIKEETNLDITAGKRLHQITQEIKGREITITFVETTVTGDIDIKLDEHDEWALVDENNWKEYKWTELTGQYAKILFEG